MKNSKFCSSIASGSVTPGFNIERVRYSKDLDAELAQFTQTRKSNPSERIEPEVTDTPNPSTYYRKSNAGNNLSRSEYIAPKSVNTSPISVATHTKNGTDPMSPVNLNELRITYGPY